MSKKILVSILFCLAAAPVAAQPDLVASVTSITPSPAAPGSAISIGWKVSNQGTGTAGFSGLKLYLSNNAVLDASDTYLIPTVSTGSMSANTAIAGTTSRTLPAGLANGTWYILAEADGFKAIAESLEGNNVGFRSFTVSAPPPNLSLPSNPSWLRVTPVSQTRLDLLWEDNSANEDGFKAERKEGCCGPWTEIAALPANSTAYQDTGLACGLTYAYRVWAFNGAGDSGKTNEANGTTVACSGGGGGSVPAPDPSWLRVSAASSTQINLLWDDNSANENGFKVERKEGCCGPWVEIAALPANSTSYPSTGLTCGRIYAYRVWAFNAAGASGKTNEAATATPDC